MAGRFRDVDKGYKELLRKMATAGEQALSVGIHSEEGSLAKGQGLTVADVGAVHEFGTDRVPQRSFIGGWFDENASESRAFMTEVFRRVTRGDMETRRGLELMGMKFAGGIQKRMAQGIAPPLDEKTVRRKGSSVPLIHTGQLRSAITWRVE